MYQITSYKHIDNHSSNTILFLHGWGCNLSYMLPLAKQITKANLLIIDLPGFGENKLFDSPKTLIDYTDIILDFLKVNNFKVNFIVGHSFGGKLSIDLAKKLNVKGLVLLAPSIFNCRRGLGYYSKIIIYKIIKRIHFLNKLSQKFGSKDYKSLSPVMKKTMSNVINTSVEKNLSELKIPIFVIFGSKDKTTPKYLGKKIVKKAKDAILYVVDGDHFAYLYNVTIIAKIIESMVASC